MGIKDLDSIVRAQAVEALVPFAIDKTNIIPAFLRSPSRRRPLKRGQDVPVRRCVVTPKPDYELTSYEPGLHHRAAGSRSTRARWTSRSAQMAERYAEFVADDPHPVREGRQLPAGSWSAYENGEKLDGLSTEGRTYTHRQPATCPTASTRTSSA